MANASDRVPRAHAQARRSVRLVLTFAAASGVALLGADARWLPLHLFLAGAVVLAISGVSVMLTVTWSAAPAPPDAAATAQRWAIALGTVGVAVGRERDLEVLTATAGSAYLAGLLGLGALLVLTMRRGTERRFDPAVWAYLAALVAGLAGVAMGIALGAGDYSLERRALHVTTNLLGLVGLVVAGTLPFFAATVVRAKMAKRATRARLGVDLAVLVAALVVADAGLATGRGSLAAAGLLGYAAGVALVFDAVPRPTRRQLTWAGPRLMGLWGGGAWWIVALAATAGDAAADRFVLGGRWVIVLVVAAYGQVLWASLAYLLPMLRGGGHLLLGEGFATTRSWVGLAAVNAAGLAAALDLRSEVVAGAIVVWLADTGWRAAQIGTEAAPRPTPGAATSASEDE